MTTSLAAISFPCETDTKADKKVYLCAHTPTKFKRTFGRRRTTTDGTAYDKVGVQRAYEKVIGRSINGEV